MSKDSVSIEELEQFDYLDNEYFEKVIGAYSRLIGLFLIKFSYLEHEINLAIADVIQDRAHNSGYIVIERLTVANKIDLFYRLYLQLAAFGGKKNKERLLKIKKQLEYMNTFRNNIVHANWQSLTKKRFVRTKIMTDPNEGQIKFRNIKIDTPMIRSNIRKMDSLINRIDTFKEKVYEPLLTK
jgi:hypothetical protein